MSDPDFRQCTETRGGHPIKWGPHQQPNGQWTYVIESEGLAQFMAVAPDGCCMDFDGDTYDLDVPYEWAIAYPTGWERSKSACDLTLRGVQDGYFRREAGRPETIEFVPLEPGEE